MTDSWRVPEQVTYFFVAIATHPEKNRVDYLIFFILNGNFTRTSTEPMELRNAVIQRENFSGYEM
ncbi:MAG: hypothetical protein AAGA75_01045 [Cyanobacteria bacterium P01_E01_bin.6]